MAIRIMDQKSSLSDFVLDVSFGTSGTMVENPLSNVFSARASIMTALLEEKGSGSFPFSLLKMASVIACSRENRCAAIGHISSTHSLSAGHRIAWPYGCATIEALTRAFLDVDWSLVPPTVHSCANHIKDTGAPREELYEGSLQVFLLLSRHSLQILVLSAVNSL